MTFDEIVSEVKDRLGLTSSDATTRIGRLVNAKYRQLTADGWVQVSRRSVSVTATTSIGSPVVTFTGIEKLDRVIDDHSGSVRGLVELTFDDLRAEAPRASDSPDFYAIQTVGKNFITIRLNVLPQMAFTLKADGLANAPTLSGSQEPALPESFHDMLIEATLVDEYLKAEKPALAKVAQGVYDHRLGKLKLFLVSSNSLTMRQGGRLNGIASTTSAGGGGQVSGATSYEQTGLITFNRGTSAPFAVTNTNAAKVVNLDSDKLDGFHESAFAKLADDETITGAYSFARASAGNGLVVGSSNGVGLVVNPVAASGNQGVQINTTGLPTGTGSNGLFVNMPSGWVGNIFSANLNGVQKFRIAQDGLLDLAGGQVKFPATQVPSADPNTLDDYEEGSWLPVLTGTGGLSGQGIASRSGDYIKLGQFVFVSGLLVLNNLGTITGNAAIGNLPFVCASAGHGIGAVTYWTGLTSSLVRMTCLADTGDARALLYGASAASTSTSALVSGDFSSTTELRFFLVYRTTA